MIISSLFELYIALSLFKIFAPFLFALCAALPLFEIFVSCLFLLFDIVLSLFEMFVACVFRYLMLRYRYSRSLFRVFLFLHSFSRRVYCAGCESVSIGLS